MNQRWIRGFVLSLLLWSFLITGAAAQDREITFTAHRCQPASGVVSLMEQRPENPDVLSHWPEDATCYYDLLQGNTAKVYERVYQIFTEDLEYLMQYDFESDGTVETYWVAEDVLRLPFEGDLDTWYAANFQRLDWILWDGVEAMVLDSPELFMIRADYYWVCYTDPCVPGTVLIDLAFQAFPESDTWDGDAVQTFDDGINGYRSKLSSRLDEIFAGTEHMTTVELLAHFDQWLALSNSYDISATDHRTHLHDGPWSVVGGLVMKNAVCEGYAKAFQLLCHKAGIPCLQVYSQTHMWNAVQVDGAWYMADPTWNDPLIDISGATGLRSTRDYFLRSHPTPEEDQCDDHVICMDLPTPQISETDYFDSWRLTDAGPAGGETGSGAVTCMMALYHQNGKLLQCLPCPSFRWKQAEQMYVAPKFDKVPEHAYAVRFFVDASWLPKTQAKEITP